MPTADSSESRHRKIAGIMAHAFLNSFYLPLVLGLGSMAVETKFAVRCRVIFSGGGRQVIYRVMALRAYRSSACILASIRSRLTWTFSECLNCLQKLSYILLVTFSGVHTTVLI